MRSGNQGLSVHFSNTGKRPGATRRAVAENPPDKIDWAYAPGKFTLGDLARHLAAIERYMYAETVRGNPTSIKAATRS